MIHSTAIVSKDAQVGEGTKVWHHAQIREGAIIGKNCNVGKGVYIDKNVVIGDNCKIQNYVSIYDGVHIGNNVFIGPHTTFTNDKYPKATGDWEIMETWVDNDVSIGAGCVILCGIFLHTGCVVGAGSVVTRSVPSGKVVKGNPAR